MMDLSELCDCELFDDMPHTRGYCRSLKQAIRLESKDSGLPNDYNEVSL